MGTISAGAGFWSKNHRYEWQFVQQGRPAIVDSGLGPKMALENGADLCMLFSQCSGGGFFGQGALDILARLEIDT